MTGCVRGSLLKPVASVDDSVIQLSEAGVIAPIAQRGASRTSKRPAGEEETDGHDQAYQAQPTLVSTLEAGDAS
jgi:hypothetical protein